MKPGSWQAAKVLVVVCLVLPLRQSVADPKAGGLVLWDFDEGVTNRWGGQYNVYARDPSWARTYLDPDVHRPSSSHSLRVTVHQEANGFCGLWMEFYPGSDEKRQFLDASAYQYLSFWIKGTKGGEDFALLLMDDAGEKREGPSPRRSLRAYLPQGARAEWQEVLIPLTDFRGLDLRRLAQLTLKFSTPGDYRFYLEDVGLKGAPSALPSAANNPPPNTLADPAAKAHRATWVWNVRALFNPAGLKEVERFFEFCSDAHIGEIYLALDLRPTPNPSAFQFELRNADRYGKFLERAHEQGMTVEGVAGSPEWAVQANHRLALAAVDAVLEFNRSAPPAGRFNGVHFDVEPYLLVGYISAEYRSRLLEDFLQMIALSAERVRAEPGLRLGCDVPAWFYPTERLDLKNLLVTFRGETKPVGEHLTDLLDAVTIMDYHNAADGSEGIIASGIPALRYAASKGKKIMVGLETSIEPDSTVYFVCGLPMQEFLKRLAKSEIRGELFLGDFRLSTLAHEAQVHVGLAAPAALSGATRAAFENALVSLARQLGAASDPERFPVGPIVEEARAALQQDPEWKGFETFALVDPQTLQSITGFRSTHHMPPKITFHGLGRETFNEEVRSAVEWLGRYPSFAGLAFHYYESYRDLVEGK